LLGPPSPFEADEAGVEEAGRDCEEDVVEPEDEAAGPDPLSLSCPSSIFLTAT
jgi:hypothetical protein